MQAAALAFAHIDDDRNGMLSFAEFEQLLLGSTMASVASEAISAAKARRMFDAADLNGDGEPPLPSCAWVGMFPDLPPPRFFFMSVHEACLIVCVCVRVFVCSGLVDFNEFVVLRRKSHNAHERDMQRGAKHGAKNGAKHGGHHGRHGKHGKHGKHASGDHGRNDVHGGSDEDGDGSTQPEVGSWVRAARELEEQVMEKQREERAAHDEAMVRRFAMSDSVWELTPDEVALLEGELLPEFPAELNEAAVASCFTMLGMRVGKMFDADEIEQSLALLLSDSGARTVSAAALVAALRAGRR